METFCEGTCVSGEFAVTYGRITQINDKRKDVSHDMIKVDISNVWGQVTLSDLLAMEKEVAAAHTTLADGTGAGNDFLGWQNLPVREATEEITRIQRAAEKIRSDSDIFVVIGIGGSYLGPRAAIELLQGPNHNIGKGKGNPQIFFAGNGLSTRHWNELTRLLEGKDFSIAIISEGMGHQSYRTTQIYLDSIDTARIDDANNRIIRRISMGK